MSEHKRSSIFNFPHAAGSTPPSHAKASTKKAIVKNIAMRVAAVTRTAKEMEEAMARGQVKPEDFEDDWEADLEPHRRKPR